MRPEKVMVVIMTDGDELFWSFQTKRGRSQPDLIFISDKLEKKLQNVKYYEEPIERSISDHALMEINLDL